MSARDALQDNDKAAPVTSRTLFGGGSEKMLLFFFVFPTD